MVININTGDLNSSHTMGSGTADAMGAVGIEQQIAHYINVIFWCARRSAIWPGLLARLPLAPHR